MRWFYVAPWNVVKHLMLLWQSKLGASHWPPSESDDGGGRSEMEWDMEYRLFGRSSVPKGRKEHLVPAKCSRGCWKFKSILEIGWDRQSLPFLVLCQILSTMTEVLLKNGDNPTSFQTKSFWDKSICIRRHHSNQKRRPSVWPVPQTTVNLTRAIHFWPAPCTLKHWGLRSLLIC